MTARPKLWTLTSRWLLPMDRPPLEQATLTVAGDRIVAVEPHGRRAADLDLGDCAVLPGFVNAHTHLDLGGLRGKVLPSPDFTGWLRAVIAHRRGVTAEQTETAIRAGIAESVAAGTTLIGDIAAQGVSWRQLVEAPLRAIVFHELLGLSRPRAKQAWQAARGWLRDHPRTQTCRPGLSPHAPYSVRSSLQRCAARAAKTLCLPLAIHLAETEAELELLAERTGPFVAFLEELGVWDPKGLASSPEQVLRLCAGVANALCVHGNYLTPQVIPRGGTLVYCPRTHAAFGHRAYPLAEFLRAGVRVALGTDSLASNPDLSVLEEARFIYRRYPDIDPASILRMATLSGAEALGWEGETGSLTAGKSADLVAMPLAAAAEPYRGVLESTLSVKAVLWRGTWTWLERRLKAP